MTTRYEERLFAPWLTAVTAAATLFVLGVLVHQIVVVGETLTTPVVLVLSVSLVCFVWITLAFRRLDIVATAEGLSVGFGVVRTTVPWGRVTGARRDRTSVVRYGGWGVRVARVDGEWRLVYNTVRRPRVVVSLTGGRFDSLAISTQRPDELVDVVEDHAAG